ncbi:[histone H4]-N-methyl-L-lysine20 N-methyltransferase [Entomortierella parvispora]|uniref:Histone-lysine N-methyltransferase SET9 n=1 Tax=Entomortierella parvispora TaxID=205924 RepID=A0A9P3HA89_9FUNG|nr:[histone H4]-N-methyl-L-lysine20 N-methyltransferase [Entomortierella parvispora]
MDLATLSSVDDVLSDLLVDKLHLWFITHKMDEKYTPVDVPEQVVMDIIQRDVVVNRRPGDALQRLLELDVIKARFTGPYVLKAFKSHARRYLGMYLPSAGYEISQTDRYTAVTKKSEACVIARRDISSGHEIEACSGSISILTPEEDQNLTRDFSVIKTSRRGTNIFLGPARFVNHDCDPNCAFVSRGAHTVYLKATKNIVPNEELTVYYDDNYFGENNCDCLCATCERLEKGAFNKSQDNIATDSIASEEESTNDERSPSQNLRKRLTKVVNYFPHLNKKSIRKGRSSTPETPSSQSGKTRISRSSLLNEERDTSLLSSSSSPPVSESNSGPPGSSSSSCLSSSAQLLQPNSTTSSMTMSTPRSPLVSPVASPSPSMSTSPSPIARSTSTRSAFEVHTPSSPAPTPSPKTVDSELEKQQEDLSTALEDLHIEGVNRDPAAKNVDLDHLEKDRSSYHLMSINFLCNDQLESTSTSPSTTQDNGVSQLGENSSSDGSTEQPSTESPEKSTPSSQLLATPPSTVEPTAAESSNGDQNGATGSVSECPTCSDLIPPHQRSPTSDCRRCHRHFMIYCIPWPSRDHRLVAAELDRRDALLNTDAEGITLTSSTLSAIDSEMTDERIARYTLSHLWQASHGLSFDPTVHVESAMEKSSVYIDQAMQRSSGQRVVSVSPVQLTPDGKGLVIPDLNGSLSQFPLIHHYGDQRASQAADEMQHPFQLAPYVVFVEPMDSSDETEKPWPVAISVPRRQMDPSMPQIDLDGDGQPDPNVVVVRYLETGDYGIHRLEHLHLFVQGMGVYRDFLDQGKDLCNNIGVQRAIAFVEQFEFPSELKWQHLDFSGQQPLTDVITAILHHSEWDKTRIQQLRQRQAYFEACFQSISLAALSRSKKSEMFSILPEAIVPLPVSLDGLSALEQSGPVNANLTSAEKAERRNRVRREKRAAEALARAEAAAHAEASGTTRTHSSRQKNGKGKFVSGSNFQREGSRSESRSRSRPLLQKDRLEQLADVDSESTSFSQRRSGSRAAASHDQDTGSRRMATNKTTSTEGATTLDQAALLTGPRTRTRARANSLSLEPDTVEAPSIQSGSLAAPKTKGEPKASANKRVRQPASSKPSALEDFSERPSKRSKLSSDFTTPAEISSEPATLDTTGEAHSAKRRKEKELFYFKPRSMPTGIKELIDAPVLEVAPTYRFKALVNMPASFDEDFYLEDTFEMTMRADDAIMYNTALHL